MDDLAQSDDQIQCYEFIYHVAFTHKDNLVWLLTWLSLGLAVLAVIVGKLGSQLVALGLETLNGFIMKLSMRQLNNKTYFQGVSVAIACSNKKSTYQPNTDAPSEQKG